VTIGDPENFCVSVMQAAAPGLCACLGASQRIEIQDWGRMNRVKIERDAASIISGL